MHLYNKGKIPTTMKKYLLAAIIAIVASSTALAQNSEIRDLPDFHAVDLDGHARIYLQKGDEPSIKVVVKKDPLLEEYRTEVRNGTLYLNFRREKDNDNLVKLYITHTGIDRMDLDGMVRVYTEDPLIGPSFSLDGDGFIKGEIEVDVDDLRITADGFIGIEVRGSAFAADISIDGFGNIDAYDLEVERPTGDADGFARVKY